MCSIVSRPLMTVSRLKSVTSPPCPHALKRGGLRQATICQVMKVFADLCLDEDVSVLVATLLRVRGFNVTTARDEDMLDRDDPEQLSRAVSLGRCIFTHNRLHYERLHRDYLAAGRKHFGIIIGSRRSAYQLARRIAVLLNALTADEIERQLLYV